MNILPLYQTGDPVFKLKLMLKQHYETGVNYLCVTKKQNWESYTGSGTAWKKLLKKKKSKIINTLIFTSDDLYIFNEVCVGYSHLFDVVNNPNFANLIIESGYVVVENYNHKPYFAKYSGSIGGKITKEKQVGIFDPEYQHMRSHWAKIGAESLEKSGNRKGCATKNWIKENKALHSENASKGGKIGGNITGNMFWWNNGFINTKSFECPGKDWKRGMLMSEKKRIQVYSKIAGRNKRKGD